MLILPNIWPTRSLWVLVLLLWIPGAARAELIPFVLPWNDATPGPTDFSGLNSPIGPNSRVGTTAAGQFVAQGQRIRFLGVNFAGDSPFMPTNNAEAVAARLAKFGVNSVRFHHLDPPWATGGGLLHYSPTTSRSLNSAQLERIHYLVSRLKAHGIYANLNLLVGREFRSGDGLGPEVTEIRDWKDQHVLGFFNETALELQQEFATQFLTPTNPFTGLSLAHDPAVALVEILNENGLVQKWYDGGIDRLPGKFAEELRTRWNRWLLENYRTDDVLRTAWKQVDVPLGTNQIRNGTFALNLGAWNPEEHAGAKAAFARTAEFEGQGAARIVTTKPGTAGWHVQFNQAGLSVSEGHPYTVSFWIKASSPRSLDVNLSRAYGDFGAVGLSQSFEAGPEWKRVRSSFVASETDAKLRLNFGGMGLTPGTVWLADVQFQAGGRLGAIPENLSLAGSNVPLVQRRGEGFSGTIEARRDWLRFLRDLEVRYYERMKAFLRERVGYPGLILGTILDNSPASVQAHLDVLDGHAYWQHPEFPGTPWDPVNWRQSNRSLVNTVGGDNTLSKLARQRIQGRPFTVTEYQHPSPNSYSAEGVLLLAAYGAFQDWDGLWLFEYGPGQDSVPMGRIRGFFDIAQHPAKMANLLLAANLFRRGDVARGSSEFTAVLTAATELDLLLHRANAWSVFSSGHLGVGSKLPLTTRMSTRVAPEGSSPGPVSPDPGGNVFSSEGEALLWDLSEPDAGRVVVNTPRSQVFVGFTGSTPVDFGFAVVEFGRTELGWVTLGLTLQEGKSLAEGGRALLVVTGRTENTGQTWTDATRSSVGKNWGEVPVLTEVVPCKLTLRKMAGRVRVWALDERGQRRNSLPVSAVEGDSVVAVGGARGSLWYEVETQTP